MLKAEQSGDVARARQIASDFPDEAQRRSMLAHIEADQKWRSMSDERLAELQQLLSRMRRPEERISFLLQVADQVGGNDRKAALGLLSQAEQLISSIKPGTEQMEGQIRLAMLYCSLKSDRGFAIMESLMPRLNELVAAAAALDGFENGAISELVRGLRPRHAATGPLTVRGHHHDCGVRHSRARLDEGLDALARPGETGQMGLVLAEAAAVDGPATCGPSPAAEQRHHASPR